MKNSLTKAVPAWHAEAVTLLNDNFNKTHAAFLDSTKRAIWMGMFLSNIKHRGKEDGSIPHGQFMPWLEKNVPEISRTTITTYLRLSDGVCKKGKFQIDDFRHFADLGHLPPQLEKMIEGKTQQQLFLEFKQTEDGVNPKRGQLKGSKGLTKEQRVSAKMRVEEAELNALRLRVETFCSEANELADALHIGHPELGEKLFLDTCDAVETLHALMMSLKRSRA